MMNKLPEKGKIGLLGGTFDPVHHGHLIISEWVFNTLNLDHIIFIPNYQHPFDKRSDISTPEDRLQMMQLATQDFPRFSVETFELEQKEVSYTVDTLRYFKDKYPGTELYYLIGRDNLDEFHDWKEPETILNLARLVVLNRRNAAEKTGMNDDRIMILESPVIDISSTEIRKRVRQDRSYQSLVPASVFDYISRKSLYR